MSHRSAKNLREELEGYGVAAQNVRHFGQEKPKPDLQEYLTLNALRRKNHPAPDGVVESQGRPVLYFVDEQRLTKAPRSGELFDDEPAELPVIFSQIACRGERAYLARIQLGKIVVAPVSLNDRVPAWVEYTPGSTEGRCLFSRLAFGISEGEDFAAGDAVFDRLFTLLKHVANKIAKHDDLRPDALSLVGRALFFRFLRDRGVLDDYPVERIAPKALDWTDCFLNAKNASDTCAWLDKTFNGDFLPLKDGGNEAFFQGISDQTDGDVFRDLSAVVRGHQPMGSGYQPLLSWNWQAFDFAHIPVGLLSQVYEAFSWEWTPAEAKKESQRYTPRNIAVTLLDEVFHDLPKAQGRRVLDPACGAGVFLVLAFRRLYLEAWRAAKGHKRPDTEAIRRILQDQLVGFDISEAALKLAALSLYLTAIELDPSPQPPDKLRFGNLQGRVLHNVREAGVAGKKPLGSLRPDLGTQFDGKFDLVLSNPPWTSADKELGERMAVVCRQVVGRIDPDAGKNYQLPDNNPDLPFLWKATEWCRTGGRIAMALPARILLKSEPTPAAARSTLFDLLQVDGIISGINMADTAVWPEMNQPWMLLFATNARPVAGHGVCFVTLPLDPALNKSGQFRIDSEATRHVAVGVAKDKPWIWKALSVGTTLDVDVIERIKACPGEPLNDYWERVVGRHRNGKGYTRGEAAQRTRDASHLKGLPGLDSSDAVGFVVNTEHLPLFTLDKVQWPRRKSIYEPPLVLIKQSPGEDRANSRGLLAFDKVAFNETFNGYSAAGHKEGELLVRYLHLFIHSNVWVYYLLATSPEFGAERRRSRKADLENCPIIPLENLDASQRQKVSRLSSALVAGGAIPWHEIDEFFADVYGLRKQDVQVIRDTLAVALPYDTARQRACSPPKEAEKQGFASALQKSLAPFGPGGGRLTVKRWKPQVTARSATPFDMMVITPADHEDEEIGALADGSIGKIVNLADETGATQIVLSENGAIVIGIYNQYRYWTLSRARLLAADVIRNHIGSSTD